MKKLKYWAIATMLVIGIGGYAFAGEPIVSVTPMVKMEKDAEVFIMGAGFKPNQELAVIFTDVKGATADLEAYLDPKPVVTNAKGEFSTVWKCGRYISKKLIKPGVTVIRITDTDYTLLAHDSIAFME